MKPEHIEAYRNLRCVFETNEVRNLPVRADGFLPVSRLVRRFIIKFSAFGL